VRKVFHVARREFWATVSTRGFLIAIVMLPTLLFGTISLLPAMMHEQPPVVSGDVAIVDASGRVARTAAERLAASARAERGLELRVTVLGANADVEAEKRALLAGGPRLALAVVDADAVERRAGAADYGAYRLFVRSKLDDRVERVIDGSLRDAIVEQRALSRGLDLASLEQLMNVRPRDALTVTAGGEHGAGAVFQAVLPMAFLMLLFMSVTVSSQALMSATIEEKSSRVIEVLLSAVSPLELMAGKVVGQLGVGLSVLSVYAATGLLVLKKNALLPLLDPLLLVYLLVFFLTAYFFVASLMAAIGAAVSELRDAQALLMPVMLILVLPWLLSAPISRDPSSPLAVTLSFVPPVNSFAMLLRVASATPPPAWQILLSIAIGVASAWLALKFAAKVFRIALLLHGKPPSLGTFLRWAREK
jgi:ABC-2 type transport system permease protein